MVRGRRRFAAAVVWTSALAVLAVGVGTIGAGAKPAATYGRQITADDQGHLHIVGGVTSAVGKCYKSVPVKIQERDVQTGKWVEIGKGKTDGTGFYDVAVVDDQGLFRTYAPKVTRGGDVCAAAASNKVRHKHQH